MIYFQINECYHKNLDVDLAFSYIIGQSYQFYTNTKICREENGNLVPKEHLSSMEATQSTSYVLIETPLCWTDILLWQEMMHKEIKIAHYIRLLLQWQTWLQEDIRIVYQFWGDIKK